MLDHGDFEEFLLEKESSDGLIIVDPRATPVDGYGLQRAALSESEPNCLVHFVMGPKPSATQEFVHVGPKGKVSRIDRYYQRVTWLHGCPTVCSIVPISVACLLNKTVLDSLQQYRRELSSLGVPNQDHLLAGSATDLTRESGLLTLMNCGAFASRFTRGTTSSEGVEAYDTGVVRGEGCTIDRSARLYGPVIIQDGVTVEAGSVILGPALLGQGSRVRKNSVAAQCLIGRGVELSSESTVSHRVVLRGNGALARGDSEALSGSCERSTGVGETSEQSYEEDCDPSAQCGLEVARGYVRIKRALDASLAAAGLIVLSPVLFVTALLVRLTSPGPVFFSHIREGRGGKLFKCWKYRTMVDGAHTMQRHLYTDNTVDGPQFKMSEDPRITRVGAYLRALNIDELPQLINVLLGQMSLIGPRPSPFRENQICVPWRRARLSVRPGITGLWQICRSHRSAGDFHQWIYYDSLYARSFCWRLDFKILAFTILSLCGRFPIPLHWLIPSEKLIDSWTARIPSDAGLLVAEAETKTAESTGTGRGVAYGVGRPYGSGGMS